MTDETKTTRVEERKLTPEELEAERLRKVRVSPEQAIAAAAPLATRARAKSELTLLLESIRDNGPAEVTPRQAGHLLLKLSERRRPSDEMQMKLTWLQGQLKRARDEIAKNDTRWREREAQLLHQVLTAEARAKAFMVAGGVEATEAAGAIELLVEVDSALDRGAEIEEWQDLEARLAAFLGKKRRRT